MMAEEEIAVTITDQRIQNLEQLIQDYEALMLEIAPHTYNHGRRARALRERTQELLHKNSDE